MVPFHILLTKYESLIADILLDNLANPNCHRCNSNLVRISSHTHHIGVARYCKAHSTEVLPTCLLRPCISKPLYRTEAPGIV